MKKILSFFLVSVFLLSANSAYALSTPGSSDNLFNDVGSGTRYSEAINFIAEEGVIKGYEDGTYKPLKKINRAEFTKIIVEAKYPGKAIGSGCFDDVGSEWFAKYVCYAKNRSIVKGNPDGTFRPGSEINTAEAYKIVLETLIDKPIYHLVGDNEWYEKYLEYAETNNLDFSSRLDASHTVTRGEMAEMIYLVLLNNEVGEHEQAILDKVNEERKKRGIAELKYNKILEKVAYLHAKDMFDNNFFSHVAPDGIDAEKRMYDYYADNYLKNDQIPFKYFTGENIWEWEKPPSYDADQLTNEAIYGNFGWMQSDEHRSNILNPNFTELGVGYFRASNGEVFFVQNFGMVEFER